MVIVEAFDKQFGITDFYVFSCIDSRAVPWEMISFRMRWGFDVLVFCIWGGIFFHSVLNLYIDLSTSSFEHIKPGI